MEYLEPANRAAYEAEQLRKATKFGYCKTSWRDVAHYFGVVRHDLRQRRQSDASLGPIVCLGVRNGREVDLFRVALRGSRVRQWATQYLERRAHGFVSWLPLIERQGRDDYQRLHPAACVGVELSPLSRRPDVLVGSFDALPHAWSGQFGIVFSNSFDHAYEPYATAAEWWRLLRPDGYLVLDFPQQQRAGTVDPVGRLDLADIARLFPGETVFFQYRGSSIGYSTFVVRKTR